MTHISISPTNDGRLKVNETHIYEDGRRTVNEYCIDKAIYLGNLERDKEMLTQQITLAQETIAEIESAIRTVNGISQSSAITYTSSNGTQSGTIAYTGSNGTVTIGPA